MKPIRVNADYEIALFEKKEAPKAINQSLEFLALYLEERPLCTVKFYKDEFLSHVERISGWKPVLVSTADFENWWGAMKDIPLERRLNSKEFTANLGTESQIVLALRELELSPGKTYLAKSPYGMSGQNFLVFESSDTSKVESLLAKTGKLIVEPFYDRKYDFSHYVLNTGEVICYENVVDSKFQYKGTVFSDLDRPHVSSLSFYNKLAQKEWEKFQEDLQRVISAMNAEGVSGGYSIDSFVYLEDGEYRIRSVSEVNFRKTMGAVAWLLSKKYASYCSWTSFLLGKPTPFKDLEVENVIRLSPGDTRFEMFFLRAASSLEGKALIRQLKSLLPECEFSIQV